MAMRARGASVRFWAAAGQGGDMEASVTENLRRGGAPPQMALCGVPLIETHMRKGGAGKTILLGSTSS